MRRTRRLLLLATILLASTLARADAPTDGDIGAATAVTTLVAGARGDEEVPLKVGDKVFQDETITTDDKGVGQFEFGDRTRIAIGPGSTVVLDHFVYDGKATASNVVISLSKGAFRFVTGQSSHQAYTIKTAAATIGVRGTVFDVYVAENGELAVAMLQGSVEVCPLGHACRLHSIVGQFLHMTPAGIFSLHNRWEANLFGGIGLKTALPFLTNQQILLPTLRGGNAIMGRYASLTAGALGKTVGGVLGNTGKMFLHAPKLRLPF